MIDLTPWLSRFLQALDASFGSRVWFVGLQGSYGRGEATETSDIDMVVILDTLTPADIQAYGAILDGLPHRELACGFLSGKEELLRWEKGELFQFYHDTRPIRGSLDPLLPLLSDGAVARAVHSGACAIFHGCVHNLLYEKSGEVLRGLYKTAVFTIQAVCFQQTGRYRTVGQGLADAVGAEEQAILQTALALKGGAPAELDAMSRPLLRWSQNLIRRGTAPHPPA